MNDYEHRQLAMKIQELRQKWQAPLLHVKSVPKKGGEFGLALEKISGIQANPKGSIIGLVGNRGCGKTQLAVEAMKLATGLKQPAMFTTAVGLFLAIKAAYGKAAAETESQVVTRFKRPFLLVIDEFGKRPETEWQSSLLFEIINHRYNFMLHTILIDNRSAAEFCEAVGDSIVSRMNENGGFIACNWASYR